MQLRRFVCIRLFVFVLRLEAAGITRCCLIVPHVETLVEMIALVMSGLSRQRWDQQSGRGRWNRQALLNHNRNHKSEYAAIDVTEHVDGRCRAVSH